MKFIFSNIIGTFVFSENKTIDGMLFRDISHYQEKEKYEEKLKQKHGMLVEPENPSNVLLFFKSKKYFPEFHKKNLELTRRTIKESVDGALLINQTISSIDDISKTTNLLVKGLREWYSLYNPEISNKIENHEKFTSLITKKSKPQLLKALNIADSLGADLKDKDVSAILLLATQINNLYKLRTYYENYLKDLEKGTCPNLATVAGPTIAAKLLHHTGSLKKLAAMPSSTIQILGAEKAIFRHIRSKKKALPPKYGLLHEHPLISKSKKDMHGKVARALADKIAIAVRVDFFKGKYIGDKLKKDLENKFGVRY